MNVPTIDMDYVKDKKGNIIYKICNVAGIACKNNYKECNCSVYAGDANLTNMFTC